MMRQGGVYKIQGKARHYLEAENDLVALGPASHEDYLSQFLRKRLARAVCYHTIPLCLLLLRTA